MQKLTAKIKIASEAFANDAAFHIKSGNKAAGKRARNISLALEKLMEEFREVALPEIEDEADYEQARKISLELEELLKEFRESSLEQTKK